MRTWSVSDSLKFIISKTGATSISVSILLGDLTVHPKRVRGLGIDLISVVEEIRAQGIRVPVLIRFQDIIRHRVVALNEAFRKSIAEFGYKGQYQGVYPIKVNQMREVVEEIIDAVKPYDFGLEAGSKAELAAVIAMNRLPSDNLQWI